MTKYIDTEDGFWANGKRLARLADKQGRLLDTLQHLTGPERVAALARYVWDSGADSETFLKSPHPLLDGRTPLEAATTQLGAQRAENLLWHLFFGNAV